MHLVIDVGNTKVKLAVFNEAALVQTKIASRGTFVAALETISEEYTINKAILSSVAQLKQDEKQSIERLFLTLILDHNTTVPFTNLYSTPETLGIDRIALVSAFVGKYEDLPGLIIDAGTCITYDFVDEEANYLGGAISPGLRMRYQALHKQTDNLPLLETSEEIFLIGNSTAASMHSGVIFGITQEIEGQIQLYKQKHPNIKVILTGGDAHFLSKRFKNSIFADSNFLLEGLNFILSNAND